MKKIILFLGVVLALSSCGGNTTESTPTTDTTCCVDTMADSMTVDTTAVWLLQCLKFSRCSFLVFSLDVLPSYTLDVAYNIL